MDPAQLYHLLHNPLFKEPEMSEQLRWKKYHPLSDQNAFICLVNWMGDDSSIVQAARVSYGKDIQLAPTNHAEAQELLKTKDKDRNLIRYLMNHSHTTPFEMVEVQFMVQVPMDCWRQWVRHRTANINEYSTRYTEALDFFQVTDPEEWRLQSTDNKQGSSGFLEKWPDKWHTERNADGDSEVGMLDSCSVIYQIAEGVKYTHHQAGPHDLTPGEYLSTLEEEYHSHAKSMYTTRLNMGIAKEQARKDLPLSTYTRAYWKCDLHNIFNFLRLRMDSHAQLEIRSFANCMFEIVKQLFPVACEAFEDYVLHAKKFSRMEMEVIKELFVKYTDSVPDFSHYDKPSTMTEREWKEFLSKLGT